MAAETKFTANPNVDLLKIYHLINMMIKVFIILNLVIVVVENIHLTFIHSNLNAVSQLWENWAHGQNVSNHKTKVTSNKSNKPVHSITETAKNSVDSGY